MIEITVQLDLDESVPLDSHIVRNIGDSLRVADGRLWDGDQRHAECHVARDDGERIGRVALWRGK